MAEGSQTAGVRFRARNSAPRRSGCPERALGVIWPGGRDRRRAVRNGKVRMGGRDREPRGQEAAPRRARRQCAVADDRKRAGGANERPARERANPTPPARPDAANPATHV